LRLILKKIKQGENLQENKKQLLECTDKMLKSILASLKDCPMEFRIMCHFLQQECTKRFPDSQYISVGGLLFLRFFCPSILAPDVAGLVPADTLSTNTRRVLVLITKILQNLSNNILFGQKEDYLGDFNAFITKNLVPLHDFFDQLVQVDMENNIKNSIALPEDVMLTDMGTIHSLLVKDLSKVGKNMIKLNANGLIPLLTAELARLAILKPPN